MKKSIYVIKNNINSKVYVGQAFDVKRRFQQHCKPSAAFVDNEMIARAIQKYGKDHFWYEILESDIDNYNEREIYWIENFNCIRPNGYNILTGGNEPPVMRGENHPESALDDEQLNGVIFDLQYSDFSYRQLAKKYNCSSSCICDINNGKSYRKNTISYPIRTSPNRSGKISQDDIGEIIRLLKYTYLSYEEISKKYGVEARAIARINRGVWHRICGLDYPIRRFANTSKKPKLSYEQVTEVIDLLLNTQMSLSQIAKQYGVATNVIIGIKSGQAKIYRRDGLLYPLRKNN